MLSVTKILLQVGVVLSIVSGMKIIYLKTIALLSFRVTVRYNNTLLLFPRIGHVYHQPKGIHKILI